MGHKMEEATGRDEQLEGLSRWVEFSQGMELEPTGIQVPPWVVHLLRELEVADAADSLSMEDPALD